MWKVARTSTRNTYVVCTSLPACLLKLEFKYLAYRNSIVSWNYQSSDFWYFLLLQDVFSKENNMWDFYRKPRIYIVGSLRKLTGIGIAFILPDPHICSILCKTMTILKSNNIYSNLLHKQDYSNYFKINKNKF